MSLIREIYILDDNGNRINKEFPFQVQAQPQRNQVFQLEMNKLVIETTLASNSVYDNRSVVVTDATSFAVGDAIVLSSGLNVFYSYIQIIASTTITFDSPLNFAYPSGSVCYTVSTKMNIDGSSTPQVFNFRSVADPIQLTADITRLIFYMEDTVVMDDGKFGGIAALLNGIVLRRIDGTTQHIFNIKKNGDFALRSFDTNYATKAPSGIYSFSSRMTFAGHDKHGSALRILPDENLELIIQDDLTGLSDFRIMVEGNVVE